MGNLVDNEFMKSLLKTTYINGVVNNKAQSSPVISKMKKEAWEGGKEVRYSANYLNGGNVGSMLNKLTDVEKDYKYSTPRNAEWVATYGAIESYFDIDSPEILSSASEKGAYMSALNEKMSSAFDLIGKTAAVYLYGGKYGVIEQISAPIDIPVNNNTASVTLSPSAGLKLQPGMRFQIASAGQANKAIPSSELLTPVFIVESVDDSGDSCVVTYKSNISDASGIQTFAGDYIELYGARISNSEGAEAFGYEGLYDLLPSIENRTGDIWNAYIKKEFRGVDRSAHVSALAGQFVKAEPNKKADALISLLKKTMRYGGIDDTLIINDETLDKVFKEMEAREYLRQDVAASAGSRKAATNGYNKFATAFGDSFIDRVVRDPYVQDGLAYMIHDADLSFMTISNAGKVFDAVGNDQLGKYEVDTFGDQGIGETPTSSLNVDKLFTISSGNHVGNFDYITRVVAKVYGNFMLKKTAGSGVAVLK